MGTKVHVVVAGGDQGHLLYARNRVFELEGLWSRFRSDSDVSRANAAPGRAVAIAAETEALLRLALDAVALSGGVFDPTVHDALVAAGYDRSFEQVDWHSGPARHPGWIGPVPGCAGIEVDAGFVRLPEGTRLDLGGIGKGYAADLVAGEVRALGASGVCVNLGGDLRVSGTAPGGGSVWPIAIDDPWGAPAPTAMIGLTEGALATSSVLRRRWADASGCGHHLINPRTGQPARTEVVSASVIAADATWAEVFAKCIVIEGPAAGLRRVGAAGLAGVVILEDGSTIRTDDFGRYEPWTPSSGGTSLARPG